MTQGTGSQRHPIGVPDPTTSTREASALDHTAESQQQASFANIDPSLTTEDRYKGIEVVPTNMPDEEMEGAVIHVSREAEARKKVPVFAYPPELLGQDYSTHPVAGVG